MSTSYPAAASTFTESGTTDDGQTLATADSTATPTTTAGTSLSAISGSFATTGTDADLYVIEINSPTTFSASTDTTPPELDSNGLSFDTTLSLFNASGTPIATNDNAPGGATVASTLPAGNSLYANLPAGIYYLGIALSGENAVNSVSQNLFALENGDNTTVRGAAVGLNPATLSTYDNDPYMDQSGNYQINLTGVETAINPVPEPSTLAAIVLGGIGAGCIFLRRKARPN